MVELLAIRRCKLSTEDPQLPTTLGHHHSLLKESKLGLGEPKDSTAGPSMTSSINTIHLETQGLPQPLSPALKGKLLQQTSLAHINYTQRPNTLMFP